MEDIYNDFLSFKCIKESIYSDVSKRNALGKSFSAIEDEKVVKLIFNIVPHLLIAFINCPILHLGMKRHQATLIKGGKKQGVLFFFESTVISRYKVLRKMRLFLLIALNF